MYKFISRQTDNPWPSYSQDLNPRNYFLWEYLKETITYLELIILYQLSLYSALILTDHICSTIAFVIEKLGKREKK